MSSVEGRHVVPSTLDPGVWILMNRRLKQAHFSSEYPLEDQRRQQRQQEPGPGLDQRGFLAGHPAGVSAADALRELSGIRFAEIGAAALLGQPAQSGVNPAAPGGPDFLERQQTALSLLRLLLAGLPRRVHKRP